MSHEYRVTRLVPAPVEEVFRAWTDPAVMRRWFGPGEATAEIEADARPGGTYRFVLRRADGGPLAVSGSYREVDPPRRLSFTWAWEEGGPDDVESLVTVELAPAGDGTEMTLTHGGFPDAGVAAPYGVGWTNSLPKLEALFAAR